MSHSHSQMNTYDYLSQVLMPAILNNDRAVIQSYESYLYITSVYTSSNLSNLITQYTLSLNNSSLLISPPSAKWGAIFFCQVYADLMHPPLATAIHSLYQTLTENENVYLKKVNTVIENENAHLQEENRQLAEQTSFLQSENDFYRTLYTDSQREMGMLITKIQAMESELKEAQKKLLIGEFSFFSSSITNHSARGLDPSKKSMSQSPHTSTEKNLNTMKK